MTTPMQEALSIIQPWAAQLGLRHQGVLMSAIRGCDTAPREDEWKWINRFLRGCVLRAHVGDQRQSRSYILWTDSEEEFWLHANEALRSFDHYPAHYVLHMMHAAEIIGYKMPGKQGTWWHHFYVRLVNKLHLRIESEAELDNRLGCDELTFAARQEA